MIKLIFSTLLLPLLTTAQTPAHPYNVTSPSPFYLASTPRMAPIHNSSFLPNVSALGLFNPYYQPALFIRLTGPGYGSLPNFTLTDGTLHTVAKGPHNIGIFEYNSSAVVEGTELQLLAAVQERGNLELTGGYLLSVRGEAAGWTICAGDFGESVIVWKGTDASCNATYVHAVAKPPY